MTRSTRRRLVPALAMAALTLTGCGGQRPAAPGPALPVPTAEQVAAAQNQLDVVIAQVFGTEQDRRGAADVQHMKIQQAISDCAAKAGITYPVTPRVPDITAPNAVIAPLAERPEFAPLVTDWGMAARSARIAAAGQPRNPAFEALTSDDARRHYATAMVGCQGAGAAYEGNPAPDGHDALVAELHSALQAVADRPEIKALYAGYPACLAAAGITAPEGRPGLVESAGGGYSPAVAAAGERGADITRTAKFAEAVANETRLATADRDCRSAAHPFAMVAAAPALAAFTATHEGALAASVDGWRRLSAPAARHAS